ncbi:aspartate-semialdehyde dehydrogenase [Desulfoplanes sp.]
MQNAELVVGVIGAGGIVGREILATLEEREFPADRIIPFADAQETTDVVTFDDREVNVEPLSHADLSTLDLVFFAGDRTFARQWAPAARGAGAVVVDVTGEWSNDPSVPLVVPGVNGDALETCRGIVASPSPSTVQLLVALAPLHETYGIERAVVSTYQAVSGAGQSGIEELETQIRQLLNCQEAESSVFPYQMAFNCLPQVGPFGEDEYTDEEQTVMAAAKRILGDDALSVTMTACWVPVLFGHSQSVHIETREEIVPKDARAVLSQARGVTVFDNPEEGMYPMPLVVSGHDDVLVGRIRNDPSSARGLNLWTVSDNLRRGSAITAVEIGELLAEKELIRKI